MENDVVTNDSDAIAAANVPAADQSQVIDAAAVGAKKSVIVMGDTAIEVYYSFTLGDMYICLFLVILVIVTLLNALIGRR